LRWCNTAGACQPPPYLFFSPVPAGTDHTGAEVPPVHIGRDAADRATVDGLGAADDGELVETGWYGFRIETRPDGDLTERRHRGDRVAGGGGESGLHLERDLQNGPFPLTQRLVKGHRHGKPPAVGFQLGLP